MAIRAVLDPVYKQAQGLALSPLAWRSNGFERLLDLPVFIATVVGVVGFDGFMKC
jgi:hypothetical protein